MHATSSPKAVNFQPAILAAMAAALFIAGIALGSVVDVRLASAPAAAPAPDASYNSVEGTRAQLGVAADTSYNAVEDLRAQSGVSATTEFDVLHAARAKAAAAAAAARAKSETKIGKSGFPSSRGISQHDVQRGAAGWWASAPVAPARVGPDSLYGPTPVAPVVGTPVSQADPNDRYGAGIR